ncbi:MAG: preprotein translocase subunit SecE [Candidatus Yanofskybacteria bacterium RIFCSPHIGHO2_01_FULL_48_25b]|uniref:Protein translocase subunit SecE n=1 Tax=Candidatus Yanofskybacteria bacterium RIFCSPHIGHO2_01_FULL_48_25b TaxID=1802672 RepID=A0A1F8F1M4_9BACT|nr:MAG: preprotein translocase subunit SecE [Candidatus Yanofskybacteria bacterium RIFCSPHIGHO2_01_FULL_48_25b]
MANLGQFFKEVRIEMAKVVWPTTRQLVVYTLVVILMSLLLAAFLGLVDLGFQKILTRFLLK